MRPGRLHAFLVAPLGFVPSHCGQSAAQSSAHARRRATAAPLPHPTPSHPPPDPLRSSKRRNSCDAVSRP